MYPLLKKVLADAIYEPEIQQGPRKNPAPPRNRNRQAIRSGQRICCDAQTLDRRAFHRMAQSLSKTRQGLGESQSQRPRILAPRLNSAHAQKTLQSNLKSPDRL